MNMKNQQVAAVTEPQFINTEKSAFSAGKKAYRAGILRSGNPYGKNISLAQCWNNGFSEAQTEDSLSAPTKFGAQNLQRKFARASAA
jgi:hypothetical protein